VVHRPVTRARTLADLERAVRAVARHFNTDTVVVIGSQAVLVGWTNPPTQMLESAKIDLYPDNAMLWEQRRDGLEASEEINALFGEGSLFAESAGFYIDGVDATTAKLAADWKDRAVRRTIMDGDRELTALAPCLPDLLISKLWRGDPKDRAFVETALAHTPGVSRAGMLHALEGTAPPPALREAITAYIDHLVSLDLLEPKG
jgi:hypothetical protein